MSSDKVASTETPITRVAKIEECESLSGLSTLQYHVGYEAGSKDRISFRIWTNSGGGKFNSDWVSLESIGKCLADVPPNGAFKASTFNTLLPGKSVNTPAFIAAACLAEGLIRRSEVESRQYERNDATAWLAEINALIEAGVNLSPVSIGHTAGDTSTKAKSSSKKAKSNTSAP